MAEKRKISPAELSAIRRRAALMVKNHRGGRKPGRVGVAPDELPKISESKMSFSVRVSDYEIFKRLANAGNLTMIEFMRKVASKLRERNAELFHGSSQIKDNM